MPIELAERFVRAYADLPADIQRMVDRALERLDANPRHPGLQAKPVRRAPDIFEARVDHEYRMTYEGRGEVVVMRNVGPHDPTLRRP